MLYVLTGSVRSGKSTAAEALALDLGGAVTLVAAGAGDDEEMLRRIAAHQAARPSEWTTVELDMASGWRAEVVAGETVLLECLGTLTSRLMDEAARDAGMQDPWEADELPRSLAEEVDRRLAEVVRSCVNAAAGRESAHVVVVTNEVGAGIVPAFPSGRLFRDALGRANRLLVDASDGAWLVVAGRCIDLTSLPGSPSPRRNQRTET